MSAAPPVKLSPFDPESSQQKEQLLRQRMLCGWAFDAEVLSSWADLVRGGNKLLFWVLPNEASTPSPLPPPPEEETYDVQRSAHLVLPPRDSTFPAIGHIALDRLTDGAWNVGSLFLLPSKRGGGIGSEVMRQIENAARDRGARELKIETLDLEGMKRLDPWETYRAHITGPSRRDNEKWYRTLGYEVVARLGPQYPDVDQSGNPILLRGVALSKRLQ